MYLFLLSTKYRYTRKHRKLFIDPNCLANWINEIIIPAPESTDLSWSRNSTSLKTDEISSVNKDRYELQFHSYVNYTLTHILVM